MVKKMNKFGLKSILFCFVCFFIFSGNAAGQTEGLEKDSQFLSLIEIIESSSSLRINADDGQEWSKDELNAITDILNILPDEIKFQNSITIKKSNKEFIHGESDENLITISRTKRTMTFKSFSKETIYSAVSEQNRSIYLKRVFIFQLSRLYYSSLPRGKKEEWSRFAVWKTGFLFQKSAGNINPEGFADSLGMNSPEYDFAAFAMEFFFSPDYLFSENSIKCRLPGRYSFFTDLFDINLQTREEVICRTQFSDWVNPEDVEHLEIIITTPTSSSPASIAGHALLLIKRKNDYHDGRDSLVLGFVGETAKDKNNNIDPLIYVFRGLTGYYTSLIQEEILSDVVERATILENRDVQRFRLNLSALETEKLIQRLWVIKNTFTYKYRFFDLNCASMLLDTLNHVFSEKEQISMNVPIVPPMFIAAELKRIGRLAEFIYPEYWSISKKARYASLKNRQIRIEILEYLKCRIPSVESGEGPVSKVFNEMYELFDILFSQGKTVVTSDPLFRVPVFDMADKRRQTAYEDLAELFISLYPGFVEKEGLISRDEYYYLGTLLLRFYMYAENRELYISIPSDIRENYNSTDPLPAAVSREYIQNQLSRIQLRKENTPEIQNIRTALSILRNFLNKIYSNPEIYTIGKLISNDFTNELKKLRENISYTHGYYNVFYSLGYKYSDGFHFGFLTMKTAMFSEEMGHNSLFALKQDMSFKLFSGGFTLNFRIDQNPFVLETGRSLLSSFTTIFKMDKVVTGSNADYKGIFNHGFGITVMDTSSIIWNGETFFPGTDYKFNVLECRYILNIFEIDEFRHFLNLKIGAGYVFEKQNNQAGHYLGLPFEISGKFYLGGNFDNTVCGSVILTPQLNFTSIFFIDFNTSFYTTFSFGQNSNSLFSAGITVDLQLFHNNGDIEVESTEIECYLMLSL